MRASWHPDGVASFGGSRLPDGLHPPADDVHGLLAMHGDPQGSDAELVYLNSSLGEIRREVVDWQDSWP